MKLLYEHAKYKLHDQNVEDLINDYENLIKLYEEIQSKYVSYWPRLIECD